MSTFDVALAEAKRTALTTGQAQRVIRPRHGANDRMYRVQPAVQWYDAAIDYNVVTVDPPPQLPERG